MNYNQTLDYLFNALPVYQRIGKAAYKADLENAVLMDSYFGHPHKQYKTVHIAGTNGKGSVSHILASVLQAAGYKTGLYTSPHLLDFRERIKVNGKPVSENYVVNFTETNLELFKKVRPSFFEMTVFMALEYFKDQEIDVAVIEVGLGGRLDTTNIISPLLSIITNIGMDHIQFLGNTPAAIAKEKAGIIKPGIPVIVGETQPETATVFHDIALTNKSLLYFADEMSHVEFTMQNTDRTVTYYFSKCHNWNFEKLTSDLQGNYQSKNIVTALGALTLINDRGTEIDSKAVEYGFGHVIGSTGLSGRWQEISHNPLVVCDIAHNAEGLAYIFNQIKNTAHRQLHMVLGFVNDKELRKIFELFPSHANFYFCEPDIPRAAKIEELEPLAREFNLTYHLFNNVDKAFKKAIYEAGSDDLIYIGGSTFVVADFLALKKNNKTF